MPDKNGNNDFDDSTPTVVVIGHVDNKPLLALVGDYMLETKEHARRLEALYFELRALEAPAPPGFSARTLAEFERHHEADKAILERAHTHLSPKLPR